MTKEKPITISIITICFNNLAELLATIESVNKQDVEPEQHLIIDGSTNKNIYNYFSENPQPKYRSYFFERDKGIADAFNKGISKATSSIINMLNSGDEYVGNTVLSQVKECFKAHPHIKWLHSKYKINRANIWVEIGKPFESKKLYRGMRSLCHQTMFIERELHTKHGMYAIDEPIAMDYDFVCRIANEPNYFINSVTVSFAPEGTSSNNYLASVAAAKRVYLKYNGNSIALHLWLIRLKLLYYILNSPIGKFLYRLKVKLGLANA